MSRECVPICILVLTGCARVWLFCQFAFNAHITCSGFRPLPLSSSPLNLIDSEAPLDDCCVASRTSCLLALDTGMPG